MFSFLFFRFFILLSQICKLKQNYFSKSYKNKSLSCSRFSQIIMLVEEQQFLINKQNIINYQRKLIQSPFQSLPKPTSSTANSSKYSICQIYNKIQQLISDCPHNLRWIGNARQSYIESYIYCLLMLSIQNNNNFLMFKNVFYQISRKYLDVKKQKLIIQFLCLLQFTNDKYIFLKKYPLIQQIILQIFQKLQEQNLFQIQTPRNLNQQESTKNTQYKDILIFSQITQKEDQNSLYYNDDFVSMAKIVQTYSKFSKKFHFMKWTKSSQTSFMFSIEENKKMHILVEKQYFFALQVLNQAQIKTSKAKLTKGDKIQVQRLLNASQIQSQVSLHQKLNFLNQSEQKQMIQFDQSYQFQKLKKMAKQSSKEKRQPFRMKYSDDSKNCKKDSRYLPPFPKKMAQSNEQMNRNRRQNPQKKLQYIDLMQSSFQDQKNSGQNNQGSHSNNYQQNNKDYNRVPKYIPKSITNNHFIIPISHSSNSNNIISTQNNSFTPNNNNHFNFTPNHNTNNNNLHQTSISLVSDFKKKLLQSPQKQQIFNRSRQLSQTQNTVVANVPSSLIQMQKQKRQIKSKQIKFYSPPSHFKQSPDKKDIQKQKQKNINKKHNDMSMKQKREQFKQLDRKYFQKKQQIAQKIKMGQKTIVSNKFPTTLFSNIKSFNNRISLQSRQDLQRLPRYNTQENTALANQINSILKKTQNNSKAFQSIKLNNDTHNTSKQLQNSQQKFNQSLNNRSQFYLKKRIFQHMANKFGQQNLTFKKIKRNKSVSQLEESQQLQKLEQKIACKDEEKTYKNNPNNQEGKNQKQKVDNKLDKRQSRTNSGQIMQNGGFQIKIIYAE